MLGVWFDPPPSWGVQIYGMYLVAIRERYPRFEMHPPVPGPLLSPATTTRAVYIAADDHHLVQLQNNMFFVNWRRPEPGDDYPRYHDLHRQHFVDEWTALGRFLDAEHFERPTVVRAQVGYVNHVALASAQNFEKGMRRIFRNWRTLDDTTITRNLSALNLNATYSFDEGAGSIGFWIQPAIRSTDDLSVIQFQFAVGHSVRGQSDNDLFVAVDACHDALVSAFVELTTDEIRKEWGQR